MAADREEAMQRVKDLIDADPAQPHTLTELARVAHFSLFHFQRLFNARYGLSPGGYMRQARVRLACHLIETTDWGMTRITREVGYNSQQAFCHVFHRLVGCPPSVYRRWAEYAADLGVPERV